MTKTGYVLLALSLSFVTTYPVATSIGPKAQPLIDPLTIGGSVPLYGDDDDGIVGDICPRFDFYEFTYVVFPTPLTYYDPDAIVIHVETTYFSHPYHETCLSLAGLLIPRDEDFAYDQERFEEAYEDVVGSSSSLSTFEFFRTQASTYELLNIQTCFDDDPDDDEDVSLEGYYNKVLLRAAHHQLQANLGVESEFGQRLKPILEVDAPREDLVNDILNGLARAISALHTAYANIYLTYANSALLVRDRLCNESD